MSQVAGLDIPNVQTVLSFDPAKNLDSHVHRVGRAGRLSNDQQQSGSAYTLLTPRNADFASVLRSAFQREGREISPELEQLANQSRRGTSSSSGKNNNHPGDHHSRTRGNQAGLGFSHDDAPRNEGGAAGHYGPPGVAAPPPAKRSRWA